MISKAAFYSLIGAVLTFSSQVEAVVIASGDGSGNTSAPVDDPGFANVGKRGSATAVYLGDRYVMTANHVGMGSVVFGGTTYAAEPGTLTRLDNPSGMGLSAKTDLIIFRLAADPGLPTLSVTTSTPSAGDDFIMIGHGYNRQTSETYWDIDTVPDPDVWTETVTEGDAEVKGFKTDTGGRAIRWGENELEGSLTVNLGTHGDVLSLYTMFDEGGMTHEAQAVNGDSGGAVFFKDGSDWKLAGIINAVGTLDSFTYTGAPSGETGSNPFAYYEKVTTAADLSKYAGQIAAIVPEPSVYALLFLALGSALMRRHRR